MKATKPRILGLILAGGHSRRMGQDKALLEFHGKVQIEHVHELLINHCSDVFLSKRPDQANYKNIPSINDHDEFMNRGPIGGILSAMKEHPGIDWLIVACDLPFITHETLTTLISAHKLEKQATAFISNQDKLPEPLCAIWSGHAFNSFLSLLNQGIHCPRKILIKSDTTLLPQKNPLWLDNINTSEEYVRIKNKFQ